MAFDVVKADRPFEIFAIVVLPDHVHSIWNLPTGDSDFSSRWAAVKTKFTRSYLAGRGAEAPISESRRKKGERGVWQRRFWEHFIRNGNDLKQCLDYLHYNPVKHGLVQHVKDWPLSSFHRFVHLGEYEEDWASDISHDPSLFGDNEFV